MRVVEEQKNSHRASLGNLPKELQYVLLKWLAPRELQQLGGANKSFHALLDYYVSHQSARSKLLKQLRRCIRCGEGQKTIILSAKQLIQRGMNSVPSSSDSQMLQTLKHYPVFEENEVSDKTARDLMFHGGADTTDEERLDLLDCCEKFILHGNCQEKWLSAPIAFRLFEIFLYREEEMPLAFFLSGVFMNETVSKEYKDRIASLVLELGKAFMAGKPVSMARKIKVIESLGFLYLYTKEERYWNKWWEVVEALGVEELKATKAATQSLVSVLFYNKPSGEDVRKILDQLFAIKNLAIYTVFVGIFNELGVQDDLDSTLIDMLDRLMERLLSGCQSSGIHFAERKALTMALADISGAHDEYKDVSLDCLLDMTHSANEEWVVCALSALQALIAKIRSLNILDESLIFEDIIGRLGGHKSKEVRKHVLQLLEQLFLSGVFSENRFTMPFFVYCYDRDLATLATGMLMKIDFPREKVISCMVEVILTKPERLAGTNLSRKNAMDFLWYLEAEEQDPVFRKTLEQAFCQIAKSVFIGMDVYCRDQAEIAYKRMRQERETKERAFLDAMPPVNRKLVF